MHTLLLKAQMLIYKAAGLVALAKTPEEDTKGGFKVTGLDNFKNTLTAGLAIGGVIFVILGAVSLIQAFKSGEQNPEAVTGGIKNIIIGLFLAGIDVVIGWFLK